jgi:hypothetical protein
MREKGTPALIFNIRDKVMLSAKDISIHQASHKLRPKQLRPYPIIERIRERGYQLELPKDLHLLHNVFHVDKLTKWQGNEINGEQPPPPPPVIIEGEEEYKVEKIVDSCLKR